MEQSQARKRSTFVHVSVMQIKPVLTDDSSIVSLLKKQKMPVKLVSHTTHGMKGVIHISYISLPIDIIYIFLKPCKY